MELNQRWLVMQDASDPKLGDSVLVLVAFEIGAAEPVARQSLCCLHAALCGVAAFGVLFLQCPHLVEVEGVLESGPGPLEASPAAFDIVAGERGAEQRLSHLE